MKSARIAPPLAAAVLVVALLFPASAPAFQCSNKLDACGETLKTTICNKFEVAYRMNKQQCEVVRNTFKDICPNQTCLKGMKETFTSCYNSAK